jgi:hypothetical protein
MERADLYNALIADFALSVQPAATPARGREPRSEAPVCLATRGSAAPASEEKPFQTRP